jgi:muramoyltetrapeptide carboxypeptidase LdcA involved in peptidoglycan recycling
MRDYFESTLQSFSDCLFRDVPYDLFAAKTWIDDAWFLDQDDRSPVENDGWWILGNGKADGPTVGGNLCTFSTLNGTPFMPPLADSILLVEDDLEEQPVHFGRSLNSVLQQAGADRIRAILIGRFQKQSNMTRHLLEQIVPAGIPIIANVDFGHTSPISTLPIGGTIEIDTTVPRIAVVRH